MMVHTGGNAGLCSIRALLVAQFLGAFNDNAWKLIVALLGIKSVAQAMNGSGPAFEAAVHRHVTMTFLVFTLPLMLGSLPAGAFADRLSKRTVIIVLKAIEVGLMAAGGLILLADPGGGGGALVVLGLMGLQSALMSPAKYGILPQLLPEARLSEGNGVLEMWTFFAIISGMYAGGVFLEIAGDSPWRAGGLLAMLALIGFAASWGIPFVPPARSEGGMVTTLRSAWGAIRADRVLGLAVLGTISFWAIASLVSQNILVYAKAVLDLSDATAGLPLAVLAAGIGLGSVVAGKLSSTTVEYALIPLGGLGVALWTLMSGLLTPGLAGALVLMGGLGIASGLLIIPLNVLVQWHAPADRRGAVIAVSNTFVFGGVIIGSLSVERLSRLGLSPGEIFLSVSAVTGAAALWALWRLAPAVARFLASLPTRVQARRGTIPPAGRAGPDSAGSSEKTAT
jgi:acyl-[acyl-carrier-protein]-phospholipid O-acyltransferase/long-chain-fatty-acid--[acyl-carrier-protein] ligase